MAKKPKRKARRKLKAFYQNVPALRERLFNRLLGRGLMRNLG